MIITSNIIVRLPFFFSLRNDVNHLQHYLLIREQSTFRVAFDVYSTVITGRVVFSWSSDIVRLLFSRWLETEIKIVIAIVVINANIPVRHRRRRLPRRHVREHHRPSVAMLKVTTRINFFKNTVASSLSCPRARRRKSSEKSSTTIPPVVHLSRRAITQLHTSTDINSKPAAKNVYA